MIDDMTMPVFRVLDMEKNINNKPLNGLLIKDGSTARKQELTIAHIRVRRHTTRQEPV
jgi:hypothetical protein